MDEQRKTQAPARELAKMQREEAKSMSSFSKETLLNGLKVESLSSFVRLLYLLTDSIAQQKRADAKIVCQILCFVSTKLLVSSAKVGVSGGSKFRYWSQTNQSERQNPLWLNGAWTWKAHSREY